MAKSNIEMLVGGFVLLALLALGMLALHAAGLGSMAWDQPYSVTARFDNIGGLKPRAPVRAAGVTVGRVRSIGFDARLFQGVVTLDIDKAYQFPRDTAAKIVSAGLLGDQFVALDSGGSDKNLAPGETIAQTQSAVVLENLIGQFIAGQADRAAAPAAAGGVK